MKSLLLIDDCELMHDMVKAVLEADDIAVTTEFDGVTGLHTAKRIVPDVILLDVEMPGLGGLDVCELLKVQPETAQIPVLFLSAAGSTGERVLGLNSGASDYIVKPFDADELRARVRIAFGTRTLLVRESKLAMHDGLTGLRNRRFLDERMAAEIEGCERHGRKLSAIMLDIDRFKSINDRYGHATGDEVIRTVAQLVQNACRREDIACRYGGEEIAILCPDVDAEGAAILAERIRVEIESSPISHEQNEIDFTCSFGVADLDFGRPLLVNADRALYEAKREGRNRVKIGVPAVATSP